LIQWTLRVTNKTGAAAMAQTGPANQPTPENSQLLMAGFAPSMAVGVNVVNLSTDAIYKFFGTLDFDVNTAAVLMGLSILFGSLVFMLDKISLKLRIIFAVFNVLTIFYFCVTTNNSNKLRETANAKCIALCAIGSNP
jgi:hypothetical protein